MQYVYSKSWHQKLVCFLRSFFKRRDYLKCLHVTAYVNQFHSRYLIHFFSVPKKRVPMYVRQVKHSTFQLDENETTLQYRVKGVNENCLLEMFTNCEQSTQNPTHSTLTVCIHNENKY